MKTPVIAAGVMSLVAGMVYSVPAINASDVIDPGTPPTDFKPLPSTTVGFVYPGWNLPDFNTTDADKGAQCIQVYHTSKKVSPKQALAKYHRVNGTLISSSWHYTVKYANVSVSTNRKAIDRAVRSLPPVAFNYTDSFCQFFVPGLKSSVTPDYSKIGYQFVFKVVDRKTHRVLYSHTGKPLSLPQSPGNSKSVYRFFDGDISYTSILRCEKKGAPALRDKTQNVKYGGKRIFGLSYVNGCSVSFNERSLNNGGIVLKTDSIRKMVHSNATIMGFKFVSLNKRRPINIKKYDTDANDKYSRNFMSKYASKVYDYKSKILEDTDTGVFYLPPYGYLGTAYDYPELPEDWWLENRPYILEMDALPNISQYPYIYWNSVTAKTKIDDYWLHNKAQYHKLSGYLFQQFDTNPDLTKKQVTPSWLIDTVCTPWNVAGLIDNGWNAEAYQVSYSCDNLTGSTYTDFISLRNYS